MKFSRQAHNRISPPNSSVESSLVGGGTMPRSYWCKICLTTAFGATIFYTAFFLISTTNYQMGRITNLATNNDVNKTTKQQLRSSSGGAVTIRSNNNDQCRFFLAESALPRSGLGLFTAIDIAKGDPAQPIIDHCVYLADKPPQRTHFHTHAWSRSVFFAGWEGNDPWAACEGFATLVNSMPKGRQAAQLKMLGPQDNAGLTRSASPGAGANTHFYGITSEAVRTLAAGSEITIHYGDWRHTEEDEERPLPIRDVSWLRKYGMCIDNIRSGPATDPAMGRGAFSAYHLSRGTAVAPAPLQFFRHRKLFAQQEPEALFVNYCFAVDGLTPTDNDNDDPDELLIYPYGPGVTLINHSRKSPNVGVRWSQHNMHHASWLDLPLKVYLDNHDYPGALILEYYALRDIQQGEELFIDYGDEWQAAWDAHRKEWQPVLDDGYVYPQNLSRDKIPTVQEQKENPLPKNVITVCWSLHWYPPEDLETLPWERPNIKWPEGMIECDVLARRPVGEDGRLYEYDVRLRLPSTENKRKHDGRTFIDTNVAGDAIYFVDKPYTSDLHLPKAFRRPMAFPKELIPDAWKIGRTSLSTMN